MDVKINKKIIDKSLDFYNINDSQYKDKCYKCIEEINSNCELKHRVYNIYNLLYMDLDDNIRKLWEIKNITDLFGEVSNSYITSVLILLGYNIHEDNMKKYTFDKEQIYIHKQRVRETLLNDINKGYDGIRISQMLWGAYFISMRIIEVGRLQYEFVRFNPLNESEYKKCIKIHIPSGKRLLEKEVKSSIIKSKKEILKYFDLENPEYYCSSWLLSRSINKKLDKNSNIKKFYNMFKIIDEKDGVDDVLNFVFNVREVTRYAELEENTSLQRIIKDMLLKNEKPTIGVGILKEKKN